MSPHNSCVQRYNKAWGSKKIISGPLKVIKTSFLGPKNIKKLIFSKNWTSLIWLRAVKDSHSTLLQGPIGRCHGQFIKLKICFLLGVSNDGYTSTQVKPDPKKNLYLPHLSFLLLTPI